MIAPLSALTDPRGFMVCYKMFLCDDSLGMYVYDSIPCIVIHSNVPVVDKKRRFGNEEERNNYPTSEVCVLKLLFNNSDDFVF